MAKSSQVVQVGKHKVEISNLKKLLFPEDHVVKAEVIQYYLKIAPTIIRHIKGRPLTLIRYPDGVNGEKFYQKNRPEWAPDWIEYETLGTETQKDYMMASDEATLVWLANLACLEFHQMHTRKPHFKCPDYIVYDLDPPENYPFEQVVEIALDLKIHLENYGYHPFVKTTGGKGVHLLTPIEQKWDFHTAFEAANEVAKPFVEANSNITTLHIKKEARKGRVLVDIYRNRSSQSIISAYSLRGVPGAPVSMPLTWEQLTNTTDPKMYNIKTAGDMVISEGDAWEAMAAYAVALHSESRPVQKTARKLKPSPHYKTPEALEAYSKKRNFEKTAEPGPQPLGGEGNAFVVHRHHASRLHYDLRLEEEGTLRSWAVPKGLPPRPGVKRLAVATEDHPLKYLDFEGTIPKGQYGGGNMWRYASGKYEITKKKKTGFYFYLHSPEVNAEYRIHTMKDKEWLLERVDTPQIDWLKEPVEPMLAQIQTTVPEEEDFIYEVKWDGIRVMIVIDEGILTIRSRNQRDITHLFPEIVIPEKAFRATAAVFDAEIVCLDERGRPNFHQVIHRLHQSTEAGIKRGSAKHPVNCYVFDCLYLDGRPIINETLMRRREWMADAMRKDTPYRVSEAVEEGEHLFEAAMQIGLEGVMAKRKSSKYMPGKRTGNWLKVKVRQTADCLIIGYTKGKGDRNSHFGALHLGEYVNGELEYRGKVGTGFNQDNLPMIYAELEKLKKIAKPVKERPVGTNQTIWVAPELYCEIEYASMTPNKTYREPVFVKLRVDLTI